MTKVMNAVTGGGTYPTPQMLVPCSNHTNHQTNANQYIAVLAPAIALRLPCYDCGLGKGGLIIPTPVLVLAVRDFEPV